MQKKIIPKQFLNWFSKFYGDDADKIDFEMEYDITISIDENITLFKQKFPVFSEKDILENIAEHKLLEEMGQKNQNLIFSNNFKIETLFNAPGIIAIIGDANEGKSNLIYWLIEKLRTKTNIFTFGLKNSIENVYKISSVSELEQVQNSVVFIDEMFSLFDVDYRKEKRQIENTIRLLFHKNNVLCLAGLGENFKKFLAAKINMVIFKNITFSDLINGTRIKNMVLGYCEFEKGATQLRLEKNEAIVYNGQHYYKIYIPYLKKYDSKNKNPKILNNS